MTRHDNGFYVKPTSTADIGQHPFTVVVEASLPESADSFRAEFTFLVTVEPCLVDYLGQAEFQREYNYTLGQGGMTTAVISFSQMQGFCAYKLICQIAPSVPVGMLFVTNEISTINPVHKLRELADSNLTPNTLAITDNVLPGVYRVYPLCNVTFPTDASQTTLKTV